MSLATQQLKVKVLWLKNVLGLSIDHIVAKQAYPLTQYYFWPRTEAWDQLKLELDSKPWLSEKEKIIILNLTTDIITHWRNYRNTEEVEDTAKKFSAAVFVDLHN
tara:strand:+ start:456 stop:770 length:315 start_codon:yes stop_codon:yes gene_type:complete